MHTLLYHSSPLDARQEAAQQPTVSLWRPHIDLYPGMPASAKQALIYTSLFFLYGFRLMSDCLRMQGQHPAAMRMLPNPSAQPPTKYEGKSESFLGQQAPLRRLRWQFCAIIEGQHLNSWWGKVVTRTSKT